MEMLYQLSYSPVRPVEGSKDSCPSLSVPSDCMGDTPSEVGARAELAVATALIAAGKHVYLPFFAAHARVDLVYEDGLGFHRVQCKTARVRGQVLTFATCSNTRNLPREYVGEIDEFGVYSPQLDQVFLVPIADVPTRLCHLRLDAPRNGQVKRVRWARSYMLAAP